MSRKSLAKTFFFLLVVLGALGSAVAQMPNPYGPAISLENAKKAAAPALAEAAKNNWTMAVAIVARRAISSITRKWTTHNLVAPKWLLIKRGRRHSSSGRRKRSRMRWRLGETVCGFWV